MPPLGHHYHGPMRTGGPAPRRRLSQVQRLHDQNHPQDHEQTQSTLPSPLLTSILRPRDEFLMTGVLPVTALSEDACTICTDKLAKDVVQLEKCGHHFHCVCILKWLKGDDEQNRKCPNCREELYARPAGVMPTMSQPGVAIPSLQGQPVVITRGVTINGVRTGNNDIPGDIAGFGFGQALAGLGHLGQLFQGFQNNFMAPTTLALAEGGVRMDTPAAQQPSRHRREDFRDTERRHEVTPRAREPTQRGCASASGGRESARRRRQEAEERNRERRQRNQEIPRRRRSQTRDERAQRFKAARMRREREDEASGRR
ncbi:hypothetical protein EK21DRAFT_93945 [Setomelanomma holmii]|uniref:RING-type domain-containing protein n=1 Tax=Setomelanomma holmii TaxID=210430 RepID=A0A9P4LGW4_9PLEO|nr:hypothetical protein EK21DRAFT_93945 [Setomelanomma holmii]